MEPIQDPSRCEIEGEPGPEGGELPPISMPTRPSCRSCHRNDRPVFGNVCGWCGARE